MDFNPQFCFICGKTTKIATDLGIGYCSMEHELQHFEQLFAGKSMDEMLIEIGKVSRMPPEEKKKWLIDKLNGE